MEVKGNTIGYLKTCHLCRNNSGGCTNECVRNIVCPNCSGELTPVYKKLGRKSNYISCKDCGYLEDRGYVGSNKLQCDSCGDIPGVLHQTPKGNFCPSCAPLDIKITN